MSIFPPDTVRGLLDAIRLALGGTAQVEVLAELRYLNQRLWGSDATSPVVGATPLAQQLVEALYVTDTVGAGAPAPVGLTSFLRHRFLPVNSPTLDTQLMTILEALLIQREELRSEDGNTPPGHRLEQISNNLITLLLRTGTGTGATSVQGWLAALQGQGTIANELVETYGNASNAASAAMTLLLECICDNTSPPTEGPNTIDPCNFSPDPPAHTARVTSWGVDSFGNYYASGYSGLPPGDVSNDVPGTEETHFRTFDDWEVCIHYEGPTLPGQNFELRYRRDDNTSGLVAQCDFVEGDSAQGLVEALETLPTGSAPYWHRIIVDAGTEEPAQPQGIVWIEFWAPIA